MKDQGGSKRSGQHGEAGAAPGRPVHDRDLGDEDAKHPSAETADRLRRPGGSGGFNVASEGALGAAGTGADEDRLDEGRREQDDAELKEQNEGD